MKIRYTLLAALLLLATTSQAQPYGMSIGARGGLTIPSITPGGKATPLSKGYSSRMAWGAGAFAEYRFTDRFSLQVGLEYSSQGGLKNGSQAIPAGEILGPMMAGMGPGSDFANGLTQVAMGIAAMSPAGAAQIGQFGAALDGLQEAMSEYLYADFKSEAKFNYVMLPVQAKWGWNFSRTSPFRAYVSAGFFVSHLVSAERVSKGASLIYSDEDKLSTLAEAMTGQISEIAAQTVTDMVGSVALGMFLNGVGGTPGALTGIAAALANPTDFGAKPAGGTQDIYADLKKFNVGFIGNAGISYHFGLARRNTLFIEGGGNYGFVKIQKDDANGQNRTGAGTVMVGFSRMIGKKMRVKGQL